MSTSASFVDAKGATTGTIALPDALFGVEPNVPVMHAVVRAHLAAVRSGTHSTKTRAEVSGGGRKPWRQKGTGRARHGSTREPQWVGGGIAHGPQPRDYAFSLTKKTRALALRSALSDRAQEGSIVVVEVPAFEEPKTKKAVELLRSWGADMGKVLVVTGRIIPETHTDTWKSFRNLPYVLVTQFVTTYKVLAADVVVLTEAALAELTGEVPVVDTSAPPPSRQTPVASKADDEKQAEELERRSEAEAEKEEEAQDEVIAEAEDIVEAEEEKVEAEDDDEEDEE